MMSDEAVARTTVDSYVNPAASERARRASMKRAGKARPRVNGHPTTSEMDYSADEMEFMNAIQAFKNKTGRNFPTWSEVLRVVRSLGYNREPDVRLFDAPLDDDIVDAVEASED
jgi:hypothetical protein